MALFKSRQEVFDSEWFQSTDERARKSFENCRSRNTLPAYRADWDHFLPLVHNAGQGSAARYASDTLNTVSGNKPLEAVQIVTGGHCDREQLFERFDGGREMYNDLAGP